MSSLPGSSIKRAYKQEEENNGGDGIVSNRPVKAISCGVLCYVFSLFCRKLCISNEGCSSCVCCWIREGSRTGLIRTLQRKSELRGDCYYLRLTSRKFYP